MSPLDATVALYRDIAAALRTSQPQGDIVLLASPNASTTIGYYRRFKTLGTLTWENAAGLRAAAGIFSAANKEGAEKRLRAHGVTHIALVSKENFIGQYYQLLHPGTGIRASFGSRLMQGDETPAFLQPIPYSQPAAFQTLNITVKLYKVNLE